MERDASRRVGIPIGIALAAILATLLAASVPIGALGAGEEGGAKAAKKKRKTPRPRPYAGKPIQTPNSDRCDFLLGPCLQPWPNDYFTVADDSTATGRRLALNELSMPSNNNGDPVDPTAINRSDGFSPGQVMVVHLPALNSQADFDRNEIVPVYDLGRYDNPFQRLVVINARTHERQPVWAEVDSQTDDPDDSNLLIHPAKNFDEGGRYIVALRGLRNEGGKLEKAPTAFRVYRDRLITDQKPIEKRRKHMEGIFKQLGEAGIGRKSLDLAWDFTVASESGLSDWMLRMRNDALGRDLDDPNIGNGDVNDGDSPTFTIDTITDNPNANILRRVQGTITDVPCYLDTDGCPTGSQFAFDGPEDTTPNFNPSFTMDVPFTCDIPNSVVQAGPVVDPSRAAMYGHGLLGSQSEVNGSAPQALGNEHNVAYCAVDWVGFSNGDLGTVIGILSDFSNFTKLPDRTQQAYINFIYLGRAMMHDDGFTSSPAFQVDPNDPTDSVNGGTPALETSKLFFEGISQGAVLGGGLTAVSPDISRSVLNVGGMNYSLLLNRSTDFAQYELILNGSYPDLSQRSQLISMAQIMWDRGETNGYAEHAIRDSYANTPDHEILLQPAFGDFQVANVAAEVEARTMGLDVYDGGPTPNGSMLGAGRHWSTDQTFGLTPIPSFPYTGSALVYWDGGPPTFTGPLGIGSATPPNRNIAPTPAGPGNVPLNSGKDPHRYPRDTAIARQQVSDFWNGSFGACAAGGPCFSNDWTGP